MSLVMWLLSIWPSFHVSVKKWTKFWSKFVWTQRSSTLLKFDYWGLGNLSLECSHNKLNSLPLVLKISHVPTRWWGATLWWENLRKRLGQLLSLVGHQPLLRGSAVDPFVSFMASILSWRKLTMEILYSRQMCRNVPQFVWMGGITSSMMLNKAVHNEGTLPCNLPQVSNVSTIFIRKNNCR